MFPDISPFLKKASLSNSVTIGVFILSILVMGWQIMSMTRVVEDAYISFRVVDNAVNGYGLRWNIDERVQTYTNVLWTLLHIPFYALWPKIEDITTMLSYACIVGGLVLIIRTFATHKILSAACFLILPLALSKTFTWYAASGLENALSFFMFCWFGWIVMRAKGKYFWLQVGLVTSLCMLNRLDMLLVCVPAILFLMATGWSSIRWRQLMIGGLPIVIWLLFSLFYYGFFFPNTGYAKLNIALSRQELIYQGVNYLRGWLLWDASMAIAVLLAVSASFYLGVRYWRYRQIEEGKLAAIGMGLLLYLLYVTSVGGHVQLGRFLSVHVAMAVWIIYGWSARYYNVRLCYAVAAFVVLIYIAYPPIRDLKRVFGDDFIRVIAGTKLDYMYYGKRARRAIPDRPKLCRQDVRGGIGASGYIGGPGITIMDIWGLGDAFIARHKGTTKGYWLIGHFRRSIPQGYLYARRTGSIERMRPISAKYYQALRLVISGDLWDAERLKTIGKFQIGHYDHLLSGSKEEQRKAYRQMKAENDGILKMRRARKKARQVYYQKQKMQTLEE